MKPQNESKIQSIMNSLDGCTSAEPSPYLLTRVMAAMANKNDMQNGWSKLLNVITRPAFALGGLILIVILNLFVYLNYNDSNSFNAASVTKTITVTDDFTANVNSFYEIENVEP